MRSLDLPASDTAPALKAIGLPDAVARPDEKDLAAHLARNRYGRFTLTEAIRPGWQLDVVPQAGYR